MGGPPLIRGALKEALEVRAGRTQGSILPLAWRKVSHQAVLHRLGATGQERLVPRVQGLRPTDAEDEYSTHK